MIEQYRINRDESVCAEFWRRHKSHGLRMAFADGYRAWRYHRLRNPYRGRKAMAWLAGRFMERSK